VSHLKEREEKVCLNCNAAIYGRFCHVCGQENLEPHESFWHLVTHFLFDLIHFDGKFFSTLRYLLFKPGYLSTEHLIGRRADYLHPIRMYIFTSAFFFLIIFNSVGKIEIKDFDKNVPKTYAQKLEELENLKSVSSFSSKFIKDQDKKKQLDSIIYIVTNDMERYKKDSTIYDSLPSLKLLTNEKYNTFKKDKSGTNPFAQHSNTQDSLTTSHNDNFLKKASQSFSESLTNNPSETISKLIKKAFHHFPQLLFISLPFFALLLQLLYIRIKKYNYVNHLIFALHFFCFIFIYLLFCIGLNSILEWCKIKSIGWLFFIELLVFVFYFYKALRNFYRQSIQKTIFKYFFIFIGSTIVYILLFIVLLAISAISI